MKDNPNIEKVKQVAPEAENLEEIGSGGYKLVYKALINGKIEAVKLVQIPSDESDETIRDENLRRVTRELDILSKCKSPYLVKLGSIEPRECEIDALEYMIYSEEYLPGESFKGNDH
jgi:serine/threonine protein kinase